MRAAAYELGKGDGQLERFLPAPGPIAPFDPPGPADLPLSGASRRPAIGGRAHAVIRRVEALWQEEIAYGRASLLAPVLAGTGALVWFSRPEAPSLVACVIALALLGLAWLVIGRRGHVSGAVLAGAFCLLAGACLAGWQEVREKTVILDGPVTTQVSGRVISREIDHQGHWRYRLAVMATEAPVLKRPPTDVLLTIRSRHEAVAIGGRLKVRARLSPPAGPALPGLNDFAFGAFFDGIGAIGYGLGAPTADPPDGTDPASGPSFADRIEAVRGVIGQRISAVLPGDAGAFATAIVTDERRGISPETTEALRLSGLAHVIAISGLNMALAAGIFFIGLRSLMSLSTTLTQRFPVKKIASLGAMAAVTAYYLVSGFGVSAERAYLMMMIMLTATLFDVAAISLRNVAIAAGLVVCLSPSDLTGPSFQMSFAATAALVSGYALIKERDRTTTPHPIALVRALQTPLRVFSGILLTSLIGGLSTAAYSIDHFHRIAAFGLIANLAAMPLISFIVMPAALFAMLLMPFGFERLPLIIMGQGLDWVIAIARWSASLGGDMVIGQLPSWFLPAFSLGFIIMVLSATALRLAGAAIIAGAVGGLAATGTVPAPDLVIWEDGRLAALVLDDRLSVSRDRPSDFILGQWQRALVRPDVLEPETEGERREGKPRRTLTERQTAYVLGEMSVRLERADEGRFSCRRDEWCLARHPSGAVIVIALEPAHVGPACTIASIVVTAYRVEAHSCASGAPIISRDVLRSRGSIAVTVAPAPSGRIDLVLTGALDGQRRRWTEHRLHDWKTGREREASQPILHAQAPGFQEPGAKASDQ